MIALEMHRSKLYPHTNLRSLQSMVVLGLVHDVVVFNCYKINSILKQTLIEIN